MNEENQGINCVILERGSQLGDEEGSGNLNFFFTHKEQGKN